MTDKEPGVHETGDDEVDRQARFLIYRCFADTAVAPALEDVARELHLTVREIGDSFDRLAAGHAIALAPGTRNVWMAHPFSAVPTAFPVRTAMRTYWANCAWDALGIPALLGVDAEISTQCADCGEALELRVANGRVEPVDGVVQFVVPPRRFWENVGFT